MGSLIDTSQQTTLKLSNPISTGPALDFHLAPLLLLDTAADFGFWTFKNKSSSLWDKPF
jgi:hypothetical protein